MLGLSTLGIFHTAVSLVALACGFYALARDKEISVKNRLGQVYLVTTLIGAATGLGIFAKGTFGPPHVLSILTLVALAIGVAAATTTVFGRRSRHVEVVSFTTTILFHLIPGFTETLTRVPRGAPLAASPEAPLLLGIDLVLLVALLIGLTFQLRWLRSTLQPADR